MPSQNTIRIGNVSGATGDASNAMYRMVTQGHVDAITGDWLSEMNIAWNAIAKRENPDSGYEAGFLSQLEDSIDVIASKGIKVVTNAGALNTESLTRKVEELCKSRGHGNLVVAAVYGDDISQHLKACTPEDLGNFKHLDDQGRNLANWELEPFCGTAYIGAWGIVAALEAGADIVICGRVTDASPVIGLAAWWHKFKPNSFDELAGALVAGRK
jgi:Acyclic terpene utilisation family protein AtuA